MIDVNTGKTIVKKDPKVMHGFEGHDEDQLKPTKK